MPRLPRIQSPKKGPVMPFEKALSLDELPRGSKKTVKLGETEILLVHTPEGALHAVEAKCPHAGAPLEQGAVCNGRLICPWHMGTFELETGRLVEPPPLRSLKLYAAQVEGDAILVDPQPRNAPSLANHDDHAPAAALGVGKHVVTIGGGAAATAAVCTLRQAGFAGRITVVDPVATEPVDRTNLSKMVLAGKMPLDSLPLWSPEEKSSLQVERLQARVTLLDGQVGTLRTGDGRELRFDAALLAPGGKPRRLGIPGEELPHVHTIRHQSDVEAISASLDRKPDEKAEGKRVVLIGDSFIAFEAASALTTRGLKATVVCRSEKPFSQKFGDAPAEAILALHQAGGVTVKTKAEAREITAAGVTLQDGTTLPADLVILAVGVEVDTGFEHGLQLEKDGGVPVGDTLKAAGKLWVAGDAAAVNGTRIEHWRLAQQHGRTAAGGMLAGVSGSHENGSFHGVPFFWTAHFGKRFGYVGHAGEWDELQVDGLLGGESAKPEFLAYYVKAGKVDAVFGCGKDAALAMLAESMREPLTLDQARLAAAAA